MSEKLIPQEPSELENKLDQVYSTATPDPLFAARLERQLMARVESLQDTPPDAFRRPSLFAAFFRRPVLVGIAALVLVLFVSIGLIGPHKVLAEVERLLGYLPNVGFVQPGKTLYLPAPVEVRQGEVTLTVTSVVSDQKMTRILFGVTGLPHQKFPPQDGPEPRIYIVLPDGQRWPEDGWGVHMGDDYGASVDYPALPQGVDHFTLMISRLPSLPADFAPENWAIPLALRSTSATPLAANGTGPSTDLVKPYIPENASATAGGVTLRVLQVAQIPQEIGLQVQATWADPAWAVMSGRPGLLSDQAGREYPRVSPNSVQGFEPDSEMTTAPGLQIYTLRFAAQTPPAQKYTLSVDQIWFNTRPDVTFRIDLGSNPKVGQTWDLSQGPGMDVIVSGVHVKIRQASLELVQKVLGDVNPKDMYQVVFTGQAFPQPATELIAMSLEQPNTSGGSSFEGLVDNQFRLAIDLTEIPSRSLTLHVPQATIAVFGPWKVEWTPPAK
jgi:hypothetical protein